MPQRGFAVHFTARSGSTYLIYMLRQHPEIIARAEIFGNKELPGGIEQTGDNQIAFLRKFWRPYRLDSPKYDGTARGFKVQISKDDQQIQSFSRYIKVLGEHDAAKIFLYRKNRVKQIVSTLRVQQVKQLTKQITGEERAHIFDANVQEQVRQMERLTIKPENLKRRLVALEKSYKILDDLKSKVADPHIITYEEMTADPERTFAQLFEIIGVKPLDVSSYEPVKKITDNNLKNVIANYDQLVEYFIDSPYFDQLAE